MSQPELTVKHLTDFELWEVLTIEEQMPGFTKNDLEHLAESIPLENAKEIDARCDRFWQERYKQRMEKNK